MADILSSFEKGQLREFNEDFIQLVSIVNNFDKYYAKWHHDLDRFIPKLRLLINLFNKKYSGLRVELESNVNNVELKMFLKEGSVKNIFSETASKINGVKAIGATRFDKVNIADANFSNELEKISDKIYITYSGFASGSLVLEFSKKQKMVEIKFDKKDLAESPAYQLCAYYALKSNINKKIKLCYDFGFISLLSEIEKREWLGKFNPRTLE